MDGQTDRLTDVCDLHTVQVTSYVKGGETIENDCHRWSFRVMTCDGGL